jgi:hypothetical protein
MSTPNDTDQKLERLLHGALRGTPDRPAPVDLEARVLAAIARGAALPWWRRSFAHWPAAARFGFVGLCAALTGLSILAIGRSPLAALPLGRSALVPSGWLREAAALGGFGAQLLESLLRAIPFAWLAGGLALGAILYVSLFGLAVTAYRTLYLPTRIPGEFVL